MLWVPQKGALLTEHNFGDTATATPGPIVTTGAASSTKGSPVELIASTAFDSYLVSVMIHGYGSPATVARLAVDLLVGTSTEEILIPDLLAGNCGTTTNANVPGRRNWLFPLYIPAGTRISARGAGDRLSSNFRVAVQLWGGNGYPPFPVGQRVITYGMGTVPNGTNITPGASGAEGSWTEITASTTEDHIAIIPSAQPPTGDTTLTAANFYADVGIGAATEEIIAGGGRQHCYVWELTSQETTSGLINPFPTWCDVPSGSRLSMRLSRSSAADTVATWNAVIHGVCA